MVIDWHRYITVDPSMHDGRPTVRGMRLSVEDVLDYLASGMSIDDVRRDFPELTQEDVRACLAYASEQVRARRASA